MGRFDFVKNGAPPMRGVRPDAAQEVVVYKHPDQNSPFWTQLTVDGDEVALGRGQSAPGTFLFELRTSSAGVNAVLLVKH